MISKAVKDMKSKIIQLIYDLRHQPVTGSVTLISTALSVFLIMIGVMIHQVQIMPFAPESCRPRLLIGANFHTRNLEDGDDQSSRLSRLTAKKFYEDLDGVEKMAMFNLDPFYEFVSGSQDEAYTAMSRYADAGFFDIFDHKLISGRYYTPEETEAKEQVAVITQTTARRLFGDLDPVGRTFEFGFNPFRVVGVIADHSSLATIACGDIFIPATLNNDWSSFFGPVYVALLAEEDADFDDIRSQVSTRYTMFDQEIEQYGLKTVYHDQPYDIETVVAGISGSNVTPDTDQQRNLRMVIYMVLLLVPAINMSSMLQSRMHRRISELGVRRAFGCTRMKIISDVLTENFILTLAGGLAGFGLGVITAMSWNSLFMTTIESGDFTPSLSMLLNYRILLWAVGACLLLNIISAAVPAWIASRINITDAINSKK